MTQLTMPQLSSALKRRAVSSLVAGLMLCSACPVPPAWALSPDTLRPRAIRNDPGVSRHLEADLSTDRAGASLAGEFDPAVVTQIVEALQDDPRLSLGGKPRDELLLIARQVLTIAASAGEGHRSEILVLLRLSPRVQGSNGAARLLMNRVGDILRAHLPDRAGATLGGAEERWTLSDAVLDLGARDAAATTVGLITLDALRGSSAGAEIAGIYRQLQQHRGVVPQDSQLKWILYDPDASVPQQAKANLEALDASLPQYVSAYVAGADMQYLPGQINDISMGTALRGRPISVVIGSHDIVGAIEALLQRMTDPGMAGLQAASGVIEMPELLTQTRVSVVVGPSAPGTRGHLELALETLVRLRSESDEQGPQAKVMAFGEGDRAGASLAGAPRGDGQRFRHWKRNLALGALALLIVAIDSGNPLPAATATVPVAAPAAAAAERATAGSSDVSMELPFQTVLIEEGRIVTVSYPDGPGTPPVGDEDRTWSTPRFGEYVEAGETGGRLVFQARLAKGSPERPPVLLGMFRDAQGRLGNLETSPITSGEFREMGWPMVTFTGTAFDPNGTVEIWFEIQPHPQAVGQAVEVEVTQLELRTPEAGRHLYPEFFAFLDDSVAQLTRQGDPAAEALDAYRRAAEAEVIALSGDIFSSVVPTAIERESTALRVGVGFNPDSFKVLSAHAQESPLVRDLLLSAYIGEGSSIIDLTTNPQYYLDSAAISSAFRNMPLAPWDPRAVELAKAEIARTVEREAIGFRATLSYMDRRQITVADLEAVLDPARDDQLDRMVGRRLNLLRAVEGRAGDDRELWLKIDLFHTEVAFRRPELFEAFLQISRQEGTAQRDPATGQDRATEEAFHFLIDPAYTGREVEPSTTDRSGASLEGTAAFGAPDHPFPRAIPITPETAGQLLSSQILAGGV